MDKYVVEVRLSRVIIVGKPAAIDVSTRVALHGAHSYVWGSLCCRCKVYFEQTSFFGLPWRCAIVHAGSRLLLVSIVAPITRYGYCSPCFVRV